MLYCLRFRVVEKSEEESRKREEREMREGYFRACKNSHNVRFLISKSRKNYGKVVWGLGIYIMLYFSRF